MRLALAICLGGLPLLLVFCADAPHSGPLTVTKPAIADCLPCEQPRGGCWPACCDSYTQITVTSVRITSYNSSTGTTATVSWTDNPSSSSDQFYWGTNGQYNHPASPSNHQVSLTGLPPYTLVYFEINAYHSNNYPYCYLSGQHYGTFTPYYGHSVLYSYHAFNDTGTATIAGHTMHDGDSVSLYSPSNRSITYTQDPSATAIHFVEWRANVGFFLMATSITTYFNVSTTLTSGSFAAELNSSGSGGSSGTSGGFGGWSGELLSDSSVQSVSANLTIPSISWASPGPIYAGDPEALSLWVGIGGFDKTPTTGVSACPTGGCFWQVGVLVSKASSGSSTTVDFFVDPVTSDEYDRTVYASSGGTLDWQGSGSWTLDKCPHRGFSGCATSVPYLSFTPMVGDSVTLFISYGYDSVLGGYGSFEVMDWTQGQGWPTDRPANTWPVYGGTIPTTGDWVIEDPVNSASGYSDSLPNFGNVTSSGLVLNGPFDASPDVGYLGPILAEYYCISPSLGGGQYNQERMSPPLVPPGSDSTPFWFYDRFTQTTSTSVC